MLKRTFDIAAALAGLAVFGPVMLLAAGLIRLESRGPVLFRQVRVGRHFRPFRVFKFRTMTHEPAGALGPLVTPDGDPRVTRVGAMLRKMKIDEFPQLLNVLHGDMSLVGPRPEVPRYVRQFRRDFAVILTVRPGLTDPASFKYRHEGALLACAADPEREYIERILPDKIRLAKAYVAESSFAGDLVLVLKTLLEAVGMEATPMRRGVLRYRRPLIVLIHLALIVAAYCLAWNLRFDGQIPAYELQLFWRFLPWLVAIRAGVFVVFRLYQGLWRYTSLWDAANIVAAVAVSSALSVILVRGVYGETVYPRSVFVIDAVLLVAFMTGVRLLRRGYHELATGRPGRRVLVFGAGDRGETIVRELKKSEDYRVVGLLDDDEAKHGRRIHGIQVLGGRRDLPRIVAERKASEVLIAVDRPHPALMRELVRSLESSNVRLTTLPGAGGAIGRPLGVNQVRRLRLDDLLTRAPVGLDPQSIVRFVAGRRVMVTGAGGSIGSELCRQVAALGPASLVLFERYENSLHAVRLEIQDRKPRCEIHAVIGDVTDEARVDEALERYRPEIVFHAAAHKHVPLMEENPCEAIKNNVRGTRLLAQAAERYGVDRSILISTDKAVRPGSVMGASKRVAELVVQARQARGRTSFAIVRFGNVLASNGSVVPRFLDQIRKGGPVTVTHPEVRRFFMLISEAVQLVLHAAAQAESGGTYVLDMGEQVKVLDMARDLIRLSGRVPDEQIPIEFVGLRPGEKLSEELVGPAEEVQPSAVDKVLRVASGSRPAFGFMSRVMALERLAAEGNRTAVLDALRTLVPEFATAPSAEQAAGPVAVPDDGAGPGPAAETASLGLVEPEPSRPRLAFWTRTPR